MNPITGTGAQM